MNIREIKCKSLLTRSNLPKVDYCINPYVGCLHGCVYCYARFMKRFTKHSEPWGRFLDVKVNAPEVLERELRRDPRRGIILLGSVTDAYQPIERKYRLTRAILELLVSSDFPVSVLTKSALVTRDIDVFRQFSECEVGLTITALDPEIARDFEPCSSRPDERLAALRKLHTAGIRTYAFIGPIFPGLTEIDRIVSRVAGSVDYIMAESLNLKAGDHAKMLEIISRKHPKLFEAYQKGFGRQYWNDVEQQFHESCKQHGVAIGGFFIHGT